MTEPRRFDFSGHGVELGGDGAATLVAQSFGPHAATDGYVIGLANLVKAPPHGGERHIDSDEVLYVLNGRLEVLLETEPVRRIELQQGDGLIVPRGLWHRVEVVEPARLLYISRGRSEARPVQRRARRE
ncbi:MAG TPA: cupin domain-containing protein [Gammaproteobacteria bacterium]|nr:cupin domain-containing protein [Gammaproteobacteria bacterium]